MRPSSAADLGIEALRGFAALLVVFTHYAHFFVQQAGWLTIASTGVDLFFVLSGFVFAPYLQTASWPVAPHFVRRFFRLYPMYVVALAVYVLLRLPAGDAWQHAGKHLLMLHTLQSREIAFFYNPAFWSLPPEVEFYLCLPLLARLYRRVGFHGLFWPSLLMRILIAWTGPATPEAATPQQIASIHLPGLLVEFMLGVMAYRWVYPGSGVAPAGASSRLLRVALGFLLLALTTAVYAVWVMGDGAPTPAWRAWAGGVIGLLAACGYACIVAGVAAGRADWHRLPLAAGLAIWAGNLSYGVYLLHNAAPPLLARAFPAAGGPMAAAACLLLTLAASWAAHLAIERPLRSFGRRLSRSMA